uniref:Fibronectin type-III domain-containing protein n=1 Tax=Parascaris equorum TaxID=6256 RepID=A0A914RJH2_PAREQ
MPPLSPNGRILNYEVTYWRPGMKQDALKILLPFNVFGFSATGLQPESRYLFGVSAENSIGWGPQAVAAVVTTVQRGSGDFEGASRVEKAKKVED